MRRSSITSDRASRKPGLATDPDPVHFLGYLTDVTIVKNAEEGLQFANTLLTTAMETFPDAVRWAGLNFFIPLKRIRGA